MTEEKFIPYLMTTSLRNILDGFSDGDITMLESRRTSGECEEEQDFSEVGLTVNERSNQEIIVDWQGSPLWEERLISEIESRTRAHDISVERMRLRVDADRDISDLMKGKWETRSGELFEVRDMPRNDKIYLDFTRKKPDFDINRFNVLENTTWEEHWNDINECDVCGENLCEHGFKHSLFEVTRLQSKTIKESIPKARRPIIEFHRDNIASWIHNNILPDGLTSPNGMKKLKLGTEQEWIVESV